MLAAFTGILMQGAGLIGKTSIGYYITDERTGETRGMGDGVDMLSTPSGRMYSPGTAAFDEAMNCFFPESQTELGEAYFDN